MCSQAADQTQAGSAMEEKSRHLKQSLSARQGVFPGLEFSLQVLKGTSRQCQPDLAAVADCMKVVDWQNFVSCHAKTGRMCTEQRAC